MRPALLALALTLASPLRCAPRRTSALPDIGSSAGELLSPAQQAEYGGDDAGPAAPLRLPARRPAAGRAGCATSATAWARASDRPAAAVHFLPAARPADQRVRDAGRLHRRECRPGPDGRTRGRGRRRAGARSRPRHPAARAARRGTAQRDSLPILLAMLGAIVAAQQAGGNSSGDATQAAVVRRHGPDAAAADRLHARQRIRGRPHRHPHPRRAAATTRRRWRTSSRRMQSACASTAATSAAQRPDTCRPTRSPLTRISEARERAEQLGASSRAPRSTAAATERATRCCPARPAHPTQRPRGQRRHRRRSAGRASACACSAPTRPAAGDPRIRAACAAARAAGRRRSATAWRFAAPAGRPARRAALRNWPPLPATHPGDLWLHAGAGRSGSAQPASRGRPTHASRPAARGMPNNRARGAELRAACWASATPPPPAAARRPCCGRCWAARRRPAVPADLRPRQRDRRRRRPRRRGLRRGRLPERPRRSRRWSSSTT